MSLNRNLKTEMVSVSNLIYLANKQRNCKFNHWKLVWWCSCSYNNNFHLFSVDPPGGSTLGEAAFVRLSVHLSVHLSPLTSFVYNSGSGWDIFLKYFGGIPGMFVNYFWIISNFLYVCQSVSWLTFLLN